MTGMRVDLSSPEVHADPFSAYAELRESTPVCRVDPGNMWVITRYEDLKYAFTRHDLFSSSGFVQWLQPEWLKADCYRGGFLILEDPPSHTKHRSLIKEAFTTKAVQQLVPLMQSSAESLASSIQPGKTIEFQSEFAYPYLGAVISKITGIGNGSIPEALRRAASLMETMPLTTPEQTFINDVEASFSLQNQLFDDIIAHKRSNPGADIVTTLINAEVDGKPLTDRLLHQAMAALIGAGYQTPMHLLSSVMIQLNRNPDILQQLLQSSELILAFIDEVQRVTPVSHGLLRRTTQDVTIRGVVIPKGELVYLLSAAGNRDPSAFPNPDTIDLSRPNRENHLGFGYGIHLCIGKSLARQQVKIALQTLLKLFKNITCPADDQLAYIDSFVVFGLEELPVTFN